MSGFKRKIVADYLAYADSLIDNPEEMQIHAYLKGLAAAADAITEALNDIKGFAGGILEPAEDQTGEI